MHALSLASALALLAPLAAGAPASAPGSAAVVKRQGSNVLGFDVSNYQGQVDMQAQANNGAQFVFIKATEGTGYTDADFSANYDAATSAGLIRGAYHFAHPDESSGSAQATFFLQNGGGWSADGITLPGALDIEYNPNGAECYGLSQAQMVAWVQDFSSTYSNAVGRPPVIYSTADWWNTCTGAPTDAGFENNPWWQADYASSLAASPASFPYASFWQYSDQQSPYPGDQDSWQGTSDELSTFARGS